MSTQHPIAALMSEIPLPELGADGTAPEWIQILPATQGVLETYDARGPYRIDDIDAVIATSFAQSRNGKIPIDQDHAIAKAAPQGNPAPARGWITEMQARDDGLYAKVKWTKSGAELVSDASYGSVSPVLMHTKDKRVVFIREVSLVNRQNLRGMAALQSQENSEMLQKLIKMLGLNEDATEEQVMSALKTRMEKAAPAAQSEELGRVAKAAGLAEDAKAEDIVAAVQSAVEASTGDETLIVALQAEVEVLKKDGKRRDAVAAVAEARAKGKGIGKAAEKVLVSLHMQGDTDAFEEMVAAAQDVSPTHTSDIAPNLTSATMSAEEISDKATAYIKKCEGEGRMITAAQAVDHVMEESQ
ncbi:phage protease [Marivita sp.]|uniref:phage protease n=1 Tax=Marivita sp. TaxID=2003365 RepID=UPI003F6F92A6